MSLWRSVYLGVVASALAFSSAHAQVMVRTTEHESYSRLILQFPEVPEWSLEPTQAQTLLRFNPSPTAFRLDDVVRTFPRNRLRSVVSDPEGRGLLLSLNCDCRLFAYPIGPEILVVDIHDPANSDDPYVADDEDMEISNAVPVVSHTQTKSSDAVVDSPAPVLPTITPSVSGSVGFDAVPEDTGPGLGESMSRALSREVARAAAAGLLEADVDPLETPDSDGADFAPVSTADSLDELIRLRTGLDQALSGVESPLPQLSQLNNCPPGEDFDLSKWGEEKKPHLQFGKARKDLLGEFDRMNSDEVLAYVKLNIYMTFDAEAVSILNRLLSDHPQQEILLEIAGVLGSTMRSKRVAALVECGGSFPLFAFLATDPSEVQSPPRREALLLTYSNLPTFLRRHLAAPLAERFSAIGDTASVDIVLSAAGRVTPKSDPSMVIASGKGAPIGELETETEEALQDLATSLRPEAADALLMNIEDRLISGETIPQDLVDTAEILAFEQVDGPSGMRLKEAHISSLLANSDFATGFDVLIEASGDLMISENMERDLWISGLSQLLGRSDDAQFVGLMFEPDVRKKAASVPDDLRRDLSERLLSLGFPKAASGIRGTGSQDDPMFAARVAAAEYDLDRAARLAERAKNVTARRLLADALSRTGRHSEALDVLEEFSESERVSEEAWRAGQWERAGVSGTTARRAAAGAMSQLTNSEASRAMPENDPTLEQSQSLIDSSLELRETLEGLLAEVTVPDGKS